MTTSGVRSLAVCLTGPESTGKTTLAAGLAARFGAPWVHEAARGYLASRPTPDYDRGDLLEIARRQTSLEQQALSAGAPLVILDTDVLTIKIWHEVRFGCSDRTLDAMWADVPQRRYLLPRPDLPWAADPLREHPHDRARLFELYVAALDAAARPYQVIEGKGELRTRRAARVIDRWLNGAS